VIQGIGIDITEIARFERMNNKKAFLEQVFTDDEVNNGEHTHTKNKYWARLFAIKEALFKAFKTGLQHGSYWHDITIKNDFTVTLSGCFRNFFNESTKVCVSHSCSKKYAVSIAFIQQ
jgi:phosphopantetheine--protein transferase-like protein